MDTSLIGPLVEVLLVNLVLSGDNAVVIGMASRGLGDSARHRAILLGGGLAVVLRLALTLPAEFLLEIPFIRAGGGLLLLWVSYRLLVQPEEKRETGEASSIGAAVKLILLADLTMSLDNILAVAAVADRSTNPALVLVIGLALSIPIVLAGGSLIARIMDRLPVITWIGGGILAFTAAELILDDVAVKRAFEFSELTNVLIEAGLALALLAFAFVQTRSPKSEPAASQPAVLTNSGSRPTR